MDQYETIEQYEHSLHTKEKHDVKGSGRAKTDGGKSNPSCVSFKSHDSMDSPMNLKKEVDSHNSSLQNLQLLEDPGSPTQSDRAQDPVYSKYEIQRFKYYSLDRRKQAPTCGQQRDFTLRSPNFRRSSQFLLSPEPDASPGSTTSDKSRDEGSSLGNSPQLLLSPESEVTNFQFLGSPFSPTHGRPSFHSSAESLRSDISSHCQTQLDPVFESLQTMMFRFVEKELLKFNNILRLEYLEWFESPTGADAVQKQKKENESAFLKITLNFLREMNKNDLADVLESKSSAALFQHNLKTNLKQKFQHVFEGIAKAGNPTFLNEIYTELYISEGESKEVNEEHEVRQIETALRRPQRSEKTVRCHNIFKGFRNRQIRTVLTKGVAGIGKTVLTQKFTLDWAEGKANQNVYFVFPFTFRQLNLLKEKKISLVELVHHFFADTKDIEVISFQGVQALFILDGLDECRVPLNFQKTKAISSVTESASVFELITNLIRGDLLPSALIWITTRPAAANQIPPQCVSVVTEVRGFTNSQKEQYFKKKFPEDQVLTVISHIKLSQSMYIMCHIPIFCWIAATILHNLLKTRQARQLPKTLTEMYIHFLVVQAKVKNVKYDNKSERDQHWSPESIQMIQSLGKLAFEQLQKGNLIFYESDLIDCGIDITAASVYSGVFTQVFREESGLYQDKVFCFVHLSVQEFLAALHVHLTYFNSGVNLLSESQSPVKSHSDKVMFYQTAIDKALQSTNGHLDLFLRFLLGLSLDTNQVLLQGLLPKAEHGSKINKGTVQFIKTKLNPNESVERCINLFHCLAELNDRSLVNQIQWYVKSGQLKTDELSASQWSALMFILLSSEAEMFDLKEYCASEEGLMKLLPVVKASKTALLSGCGLSKRSCRYLAALLNSKSCCLEELDLSNNNLTDAGMKELAPGLKSPHCKLKIIRLSGCLLTEEGSTILASALKCNPSHLKMLDVSYNNPGNEGLKELFGIQSAPRCNLETLSVNPAGRHWMISDLMKYFTKIPLDPNTVNKCLQLSNYNRKVTHALKDLSYADHPDRFEYWHQVLCMSPLTDRYYQEIDWTGEVDIGITYKRLQRKGNNEVCRFGDNNHSWRLRSSQKQCYMCHNNEKVPVHAIFPNRVGVYVDYPAGVLSFFSVASDRRVHLCTINTTFTEPLYLGIGLRIVPSPLASSASLCDLSDEISFCSA